MLRKKFFLLIPILVIFCTVIASHASFAQMAPLENVPGFESETQNVQDFPAYITSIYNLAIWIVGISALLMGSFGAFTYLTSAGNTSQVNKGKDIIKDAMIGLILVLATWLILHTINPDLVNWNFNRLNSTAGAGSSGVATTIVGDPARVGSAGNCGGVNTSGSAPNQCGLVSSVLNAMLSCMKSKGTDSLGSVYSISAANVGNDLAKAKACCGDPSCTHATQTCHYGCGMPDQGYSHAVDFSWKSGDDATLCKIADAAVSCGGGTKIWGPRTLHCPGGAIITQYDGHNDHLHIPTADCNH